MAQRRTVFFLSALLIFLLLPLQAGAASERVVVGILPFFDNSAEEISDRLAPNLSYFLYQELLKSPDITPVLLSPGGLYDPDSEEFIESYGGRLKVDVVLIGQIQPSIKVNDHTSKINIQVEMVDLATGKHAPKQTNSEEKVPSDSLIATAANGYMTANGMDFFHTAKDFSKLPLGKATMRLADWAANYLETSIKSQGTVGTGQEPAAPSGSCQIGVRILYMQRHAASKSYSLFVNNEDEGNTVKEGTATFAFSSGPLALRFQVNDAPYRFPFEKLYASSTYLDCSQAGHNLVIELGTSGEATPHWE